MYLSLMCHFLLLFVIECQQVCAYQCCAYCFQTDLQSQFCHIARQLLESWKEERLERRPPSLSTGVMIGHLITIAENSGDHDLAWSIFEAYNDNKNTFAGSPSDSSMKLLVTGCLERGDVEQAVNVVTVMDSLEMAGTSEAVKLILDSDKVTLSQSQRDMLANM